IISCAALAPFGHGERTVVDKDVRDTWEVEPSKLSFSNPEWEEFLTKTVCPEVCKSLGVPVGECPPKMELYKLLLYEQGSHFLPHQDTQKADGMFATVIIILPSPYTGGQVVVSHAATTKTLDFSEKSLLSTAALAWYTDEYEKGSECDIIAYLLDHEYSAANLKEGLDSLKGVDAHRVTLLGPIAEQLGFVVGLASL
ncbi:hypothetical protein M413DRAFT_44730, partial [Hebeloma cylindrosporum]